MEENTQLPKEDNNIPVTVEIVDLVIDMLSADASRARMEKEILKLLNKHNNATKANEAIKVLNYDNNRLKGEVEGYKEAHDDHKRLVRHLDLLINGDAAAEQASLCDLVKQIESFGLPAVNNPNYKGGAEWVKCWEQKPDTHKVRFKDKHGNEFIGNYSKDTGQYWAYGLEQAINDVIYWRTQDESAAGREEAVSKEVLDFIRDIAYNWDCDEDSHKYNTVCRKCSASELYYDLTKQQKEK